jgi:hypothetical protein
MRRKHTYRVRVWQCFQLSAVSNQRSDASAGIVKPPATDPAESCLLKTACT